MMRRATRRGGPVLDYVRSTRAGATALSGVLITLAAFAGVGFAGDYLVLTGQRDLLKAAANAATVATIKHFAEMNLSDGNGGTLSDEDLDSALRPVAKRYLLANMPPNKREKVEKTLDLAVVPDRASRTVAITAHADLGGILFLKRFGLIKPSVRSDNYSVGVRSGAVRDDGPSEVVLAIDTTGSMFYTLAGEYPPALPDYADYADAPGGYPFTKLNIVKAAAKELVSILNPDGNGAAVGIVPWQARVRLGPGQRDRWVRKRWARYPHQRTYPNPYSGAPPGGETITLPLEGDQAAWRGCFDQRALVGTPAPALSPALPSDHPFTMNYYTHELFAHDPVTHKRQPSKASFACRPKPAQDHCYDPDAEAGQVSWRLPPQPDCELENRYHQGEPGHIVPLTTDSDDLHSYLDLLGSSGASTYSALGMVWALRLLDPDWRAVWGDPVLPRDHGGAEGAVRKAIVLLTDGEDNHVPDAARHLQIACTTAKNAGVRVFVIAAMALYDMRFRDRLKQCSSNADFPDVEHVFVNNATPEQLRETFRTIGRQLKQLRLVQ